MFLKNFKLVCYFILIISLDATHCELFQYVKDEFRFYYNKFNWSINHSIVSNSFNVNSLVRCTYRCTQTSNSSVYFSDNESICYCNNGTDTRTEHEPGQSAIIYGYFGYQTKMSKYNQFFKWDRRPRKSDCLDLYTAGYTEDGVYTIQPSGQDAVDTWCDMQNGGWTVFQRRQDGSEDFYRGWTDYVDGFGNRTGEYWLGLDNIKALTSQTSELHIFMETFGNKTPDNAFASYTNFTIGSSTTNYRLHVDGFSSSCNKNPFDEYGKSMAFSTFDADHDTSRVNCALKYKGAWWYDYCHRSNLNGYYYGGAHTSTADGVNWAHCWGQYYSLKTTIMKIRRK